MADSTAAALAVIRAAARYAPSAARLALALLVLRLLRRASNPGKIMQSMLTFISLQVPSELPGHALALHTLLFAKGAYGRPGRGGLETAGMAAAGAAFIPLLQLLYAQWNCRSEYTAALTAAGVPVRLANRQLGWAKMLSVAFPTWWLLNRNLQYDGGIVYGTAPRQVRIRDMIAQSAASFGVTQQEVTVGVESDDAGATPSPAAAAAAAAAAATPADPRGDRALKLDIYRHKTRLMPNAPVFFYIHGGGWILGHRHWHGIPLLMEVARAGYCVVSIEYRLAPRVPFPGMLYDVKRALAWVKKNIGGYGGDATFIIAAGESAGGHLALLTGLTANVPAYQQHHADTTDADTTVQGVVDLYGVTDWTDSGKQWSSRAEQPSTGGARRFLEKLVLRRAWNDHTHEFVRASPLWWLHGTQLPRALAAAGIVVRQPAEVYGGVSAGGAGAGAGSGAAAADAAAAAAAERAGPNGEGEDGGASTTVEHPASAHDLVRHSASSTATAAAAPSPLISDMCVDRAVPPILIVHGEADTVVPIEDSKLLWGALTARRERDAAAGVSPRPPAPDVLIELSRTHHAYNFVISPRSLALADAVVDWCNHLYAQARPEAAAAAAAAVAANAAGLRGSKL